MNKLQYILGIYLSGFFAIVLAIAGLIAMIAETESGSEMPVLGISIILTAAIPGIFSIYVRCRFVYRMWDALQGRGARTTPLLAVLLSFIPLWHFYWNFQVYWGWAKDYNEAAEGHDLPEVNDSLFLGYAICGAVQIIAGTLAGLAMMVLYIIMIIQVCDAVNAMRDCRPDAEAFE